MKKRQIAILGATGFLGRVLVRHFNPLGWNPVPYTRKPIDTIEGVKAVRWNPENPQALSEQLSATDIVINLCGKSVDCRYNRQNRKRILNSRTTSTRSIAEAINLCPTPPATWINAASATIYKSAFEEPQTETDGLIGHGFSVNVCQAWENAFLEKPLPQTRRIVLRTALVLGEGKNSVYPRLRTIARFGLGGTIGNGYQMVSWIHERDFARAVQFLIENEELSGVFNIASPAPVRNSEFMKNIRIQTRMPLGLPTPKWLLEIGAFLLRTEPELVLKSRFVAPERLMRNRFQFRFPFIDEALADLERQIASAKTCPSTVVA